MLASMAGNLPNPRNRGHLNYFLFGECITPAPDGRSRPKDPKAFILSVLWVLASLREPVSFMFSVYQGVDRTGFSGK